MTKTETDRKHRTTLWHDLIHMKVEYVLLITACLIAGHFIREQLFPPDTSQWNAGDWTALAGVPLRDDWEAQQQTNRNHISGLAGGETRTSVVAALGPADFSERYGEAVEILYYRTQQETADFLTTRDETTPLIFIDDRLASRTPTSGVVQAKPWVVVDPSENREDRETRNRMTIAGLQAGITRQEIITRLGPPDFEDVLAAEFEVLSYRTRSVTTDGLTTRDETTPLLFRAGELLGAEHRHD